MQEKQGNDNRMTMAKKLNRLEVGGLACGGLSLKVLGQSHMLSTWTLDSEFLESYLLPDEVGFWRIPRDSVNVDI